MVILMFGNEESEGRMAFTNTQTGKSHDEFVHLQSRIYGKQREVAHTLLNSLSTRDSAYRGPRKETRRRVSVD